MLELSRTVRFCLNDGETHPPPRHNGFSAWPPIHGLGRFYQIHLTCRGHAHPLTGYFLDIKQIDAAVRDHALPLLRAQLRRPNAPLGPLLHRLLRAVQPDLRHTAVSFRLDLTPFVSLEARTHAMKHLILRQQYEFAAAHRLHVPSLSASENRRLFGKCNNPSGHGHNYRLQVAVRCPARRALPVHKLDELVDRAVIRKLDHKHLNTDVPAFARLNPSVENIAQVIHQMLARPLARLGAPLEEITVWETDKTLCTCRA